MCVHMMFDVQHIYNKFYFHILLLVYFYGNFLPKNKKLSVQKHIRLLDLCSHLFMEMVNLD